MLLQRLTAWVKKIWPQKEIYAGEKSGHLVPSAAPEADLKVLVKDLLEVTSIILKDESLVNKEKEKLNAVSSSAEIVDTALKILQSVRIFLAENHDIQGPSALPALWWWALVIGCVGGCLVNIYFILHGTSLLVQINPVPYVAFLFLATFTVLLLLFSKHVWLDRLGGGTFLFYFFIVIWFVSLLFNLGVSYWVFKVSYRLDIPQNVDPGIGAFMKEALPLAAGILLTVFPIMLGILLFPDKKRTVLKG